MFANSVQVEIAAGKLDEVVEVFRNVILPLGRDREGFVDAYLMFDHDKSTLVTLSMWTSREAIDKMAESGFLQEAIGKVKHRFASAPVRSVYEVTLTA